MEYTPILNGCKLISFKPYRGICQGDPLFSYLFILAMEYFSTLINVEVENKRWNPFKFKNHNLNVSHLLFVYDVLIFAKADNKSILSIKKYD